MADPTASLQEALGDRYAVEAEIGRGGMAVVYRATDRRLGRTVAIKVLSPDLAPLLGEERFHREITVAARLQHPGIVPLYEAGGTGSLLYYTMPYVEGETLRARLDRERQLPLDDVVRITLEVADALRHAHGHDVVHRDIKPENILLTGDRVQVADFGIARAISIAGEDRLTSAGVAIGTPAYMSPEQATHDEAIDGRADIYSLGCVCYEMLTGQPPFTGATPQALIARHIADPVPSLRVVRPATSAALEAVVATTLAKIPADRPDAAHLMTAVREAVAHPERGRRRPVRWIGLAGITAFLALLGWFLLLRPQRPIDRDAVVVFPLSTPGTTEAGLGDLVVQLIGSVLTNTQPLRWLDGAPEMSDPGDPRLPAREARDITRRLGAGWYITGALLPHDDSLTVTLRLHDLVSGETYEGTSSGPAGGELSGTASRLGQQALMPMLERLVGPAQLVDLGYLRGRNLKAIVLWLQGEQLRRSARFDEALDSYLGALAIDSTLAVAALAASGVAIWTRDAYALADSLARLALHNGDGMPPRNIAYARGLVAWVAKASDSAVAEFRRVIAIDSLWPEGWMMLGDSYYHLFPDAENSDSIAIDAFRHSVALDSRFAPALFHLAEEAFRSGRLKDGDRWLQEFRRLAPAPGYVSELEMLRDCQERGAQAVPWAARVREAPLRVLTAARLLAAGGRHPECARLGADALLAGPPDSVGMSIRWSAFVLLHHLRTAMGDRAAVTALVDSGVRSVHPAAQGLYVLDALEIGGDSARAASVIAALDAPLGGLFQDRLWYLGRWAAQVRDDARLAAIIARLDTLADRGNRGAATVGDGLAARAALLRGDTVTAIDRLRRLQNAPGETLYGLWESGASEQILLARLLLATGQPGAAFRIAARFDQTQTLLYLYHLPESLEIRARAATLLGDDGTARAMRDRLARLQRDPAE